MNTKFKYTRYGLILELQAANDNERTLVDEFMGSGRTSPKLKGMIVRPGLSGNSIEVVRPVYISSENLRDLGFSDRIENIVKSMFVLNKAGKAYIIYGNGFFTLYVFGADISELLVLNPPRYAYQVGSEEFTFNEDYTINLSDAEFTSDKINQLQQLDELLLKY